MILGLAFKSLKSKPWRTVALIAAIALSVAMFFCMFSFEGAVYEYVYAVETADSGDSDIMISAKSGGDRIALVDPLYGVDGVESVTATVSVYALIRRENAADEYIRLRGFADGGITALGGVSLTSGGLPSHSDDVVISEAMSEHFGLGVGDVVTVQGMTASGRSVNFFVSGIAENTGAFTADSPYVVLGHASRVSSVIIAGTVYNEIFVHVADGADAAEVRDSIAALPEYSGLTVSECPDLNYISVRARNLAAPVTIAGAAVALLCLVGVVLIFTAGTGDRRAYAAKLSLVGATKKKIFALFCIESAVVAAAGAVIGSLLAVGVFALMLYIVLSSAMSFSVNAALLFAAAAAGALAAFAASLYPLVRVFRATARENLQGTAGNGRIGTALSVGLAAAAVITLCTDNLVPGAKGALSAVNIVIVIALAACIAPFLVRAAGKALVRTCSPSAVTAGYAVSREHRASRSSRILAVGMTVSMLLFIAWSLTTSIFSDFTAEFEQMILVTNVATDVDEAEFTGIDGVESAHLMVWRQAELSADGLSARSVNILGSADAIDLVEFEYVSARTDVENALAAGKVVLDESMRELYGIDVGDAVVINADGTSRVFEVGAVVRHNLFNGAYVIVSAEALDAAYGLSPDTVVLTVSGDAGDVAEEVRSHFADRNYYAVPALEAYEWDTRSLENVFDLIAALAFMLTGLAFAVALSNVVVGRAYSAQTRSNLLCAGLSRNGLLGAETLEHAVSAVCAFALALPVSALAALCLINALTMFGFYFEFMYNAAAAAAAGLAITAAYVLIPVVLGFRRGYGMRRHS